MHIQCANAASFRTMRSETRLSNGIQFGGSLKSIICKKGMIHAR